MRKTPDTPCVPGASPVVVLPISPSRGSRRGASAWSPTRTGLHQRNAVADTGVAVLVVRLDLGRGPDDLAVQRMALAVLELDHDGLLHLVADHVADDALAATARLFGTRSVLGTLFALSLLSAITIPHLRVRRPDPTHVHAARCTRVRFPDGPCEAGGCWRAVRSPSSRLNSSSLDSRSRSFNSSSVSSRIPASLLLPCCSSRVTMRP